MKKNEVSSDEQYYRLAGEASEKIIGNPGLEYIAKLASRSNLILDVGCGEGTRLNSFKHQGGYGVDISRFSINLAKKKYPHHRFRTYSGKTLPYRSNNFDLVYSAFVLEHTQNPKEFIKELFRVVRVDGFVAIICPNYGAPNRRSPVSKENPVKKLISGLLSDAVLFSHKLHFTKVTPKRIFKNIDDDTTIEPYLYGLLKFLRQYKNLELVRRSSLWEIDNGAYSLHQRLFKHFGLLGLWPFSFWGPQLFIVVKKIRE